MTNHSKLHNLQLPNHLKRVALIWSLISTALLWLHAQLYQQFLSDDALISMRYSERLLEGHGLTWTDGIPVEGYSNLLWVLLTAALGAVGIDLVDAVRLLGFICNASVIFALLYLYNKQLHLPEQPQVQSVLVLVVAQLFWVLSGSTAVWTMGGLEQPLVAAGIVWACVLVIPVLNKPEVCYRALLFASVALAAVVLTRPDGPLFTACLCVIWWCVRPKNMQNFMAGFVLGAIPFAAFVGQMGFRLSYYGDWVPNTAHVKVVFSNSRITSGIRYTLQALSTTSPFLELLLAGCAYGLYKKRNHIALALVIVPMLAWLGYISSVGGDIFPAFRHGLLVYGLMSIALLIIALNGMQLLNKTTPVLLQWSLVVLVFVPFFIIQVEHPQNKEAFYEKWEWDGQAVGETLHAAFKEEQPLYAITAAGSLPYWSKLPVLDMLGLNDHHIARNPPEDFGQGELGHDLGDGAYVLSRKPAIISFCGPFGSIEPCRLSGQQMVATEEFHEYYVPVYIDIKPTNGRPDFTNIQWVRWQDSPIGLQNTDTYIAIPAYLGSHTKELAAHLAQGNESELVVALEPGQSIALPITQEIALITQQAESMSLVTDNDKLQLPTETAAITAMSNTHVQVTNRGDTSLEIKSLIIEKPYSRMALLEAKHSFRKNQKEMSRIE